MGSRSRTLMSVFIAAWVSIASVALWQVLRSANESILAITAGVLLVVSLIFSRFVLKLAFTSSAMLYLVLLGLFHLGLVVPWALGIYDATRMSWFDSHGLSEAIGLIIYAILAFQLGLMLGLSKGPDVESRVLDYSKLENRNIYFIGLLLFVPAAFMFVIQLVGMDPSGYDRLIYSEYFRLRAESEPRLFGSGITVAYVGLCLAIAGASRKRVRITLAAAGIWVLILFYLGFRGPALIAGLIVCTVVLKKGVTFPRWAFWLAVGLLLVAIPIMRSAREEPILARSNSLSLSDFNILDGPAEMGESVRPLVETTALVGPKNYWYGKTYWIGLKAAVPTMAAWDPTATVSIDELAPNNWLIAVVDPWTFEHYGGLGFSAVAEPYMNFGTAGVLGYFLLLGVLLVRLDQLAIQSSYGIASWALIMGPLLWTTRNDSANFFRPAIFGLLCLGIVRLYSGGFKFVGRALKKYEIEIDPKAPRVPRINGGA
jgi:O-antigen polysaccharide polymerase Wzy